MNVPTATRPIGPAWKWFAACAGVLALVACGSDDDDDPRGTLSNTSWPKTASMTPAELQTRLGGFEEGRWIVRVAGAPTCGVDVYRFEYHTVDGKGQPTTASSALMVPTGTAPQCTGARPLVMTLHGTVTDKAYNAADLSGTNSASLRATTWAGIFAAQGYIVVAPNYAGFDTSPLPYHPYLNAEQQSKDVMDALSAARSLLPQVPVSASKKLFLTGYSQGGYVAMATHRAMQAAGMEVTAAAPASGAYALSAQADDIFLGRPLLGSTIYFPMVTNSFQNAYGDIYGDPAEIYSAPYAPAVATLLPSLTPFATLVGEGKVPASAAFNATAPTVPAGTDPAVSAILAGGTPAASPAALAPAYALGFGASALIDNSYRVAYLQDIVAHPDGAAPVYSTGGVPSASQNGLRRAFIRNDLRGWTPRTPVMMCGGQDDPAVAFRLGADLMARYWSTPATAAPAGIVSVLDMETAPTAGDPYAALKQDFATLRGQLLSTGGQAGLLSAYHTLLQRYCYTSARTLFDTLR